MKKRFLKYPLIGLVLGALIVPTLVSCNPINEPYNNIQIPLPDNNHNNGGSSNQLPPEPTPESPPPPQIIEPDVMPNPDLNEGGDNNSSTNPNQGGNNNSNETSNNKIVRPDGATELDKLRQPIPKSVTELYGSGDGSLENDFEVDYYGNPTNKVVKATESEFVDFWEKEQSYFGWYKQEFNYQAYFLKWLNFDNFGHEYIEKSDIYVTNETADSITYEMQALLKKDANFLFYAPYDDSHLNGNNRMLSAGDLIKINIKFSVPNLKNIVIPFSIMDGISPWSCSGATLSSWDPINHTTRTLKGLVFNGQFDIKNGWGPIKNGSQIYFTVETKKPDGQWMYYLTQKTNMQLKLLSINKNTVKFI